MTTYAFAEGDIVSTNFNNKREEYKIAGTYSSRYITKPAYLLEAIGSSAYRHSAYENDLTLVRKNGTFKAGDKVTSTSRSDKDEVFTVVKPSEWGQWTRNPKDAYTVKSDKTGYQTDFYADTLVLVEASAVLTQVDVDKAVKEAIDALAKKAAVLADERGYCDDYDKIAKDLGLPAREKDSDYTVYVPISGTVIVKVKAKSQEDAIEKAEASVTRRSVTDDTLDGYSYTRINGVFEFPREVFLPENVVNSAAEADILPLGTVMWREDADAWLADDSVKTANGWTIINPEWLSAGMVYKSGVYGYPRRYSLPNEEDYVLIPDETAKKEVTMSAITSENFMVKRYSMFEFSLSRAEWASWQSSVDWTNYSDLTSMSIIALTQEEALGKARAVAFPRSGYTWVFKVLDVRELR